MNNNNLFYNYIKRILDIIFSILLLILLFPIYLILYIIVLIKLGYPVIFKQERPGLNEKIFFIYKFRTMTNEKDNNGVLLSDAERLTSFGKFLRSTSLDELPELFNVLIGDMSFVGPRPLLVKYLDRYNDFQRRRHLVRPGITGLAQVMGRNSLSWEDKFKYDIEYVDNISFILDLKILLKTILIVFSKKGISSDTSVTMEEFK